jgi:hypothetical protein
MPNVVGVLCSVCRLCGVQFHVDGHNADEHERGRVRSNFVPSCKYLIILNVYSLLSVIQTWMRDDV